MKGSEYFFIIAGLLLVVVVASASSSENYNNTYLVTDLGGSLSSETSNNSIVGGIVSGDLSSDNYTNQLGVFYGLNVVPDNPIVFLNTSSGNNVTSNDLLCNAVVHDDDGDILTVSVNWYLNNSLNLSVEYPGVADGTSFSAILDSSNTTKNDVWNCGMKLNDGSRDSSWVNASNLTILNSLPVVTLFSPSDNSATTNRTPLFNWTAIDLDGDILTYDINITPYSGDNPSVLDVRYETGLNDLNFVPSPDLLLLYDNGYHYRWKVRANDGDDYGEWTDQWSIDILSEVSIILTVDNIYFGDLLIGESNSTEEGIAPFEIENNGNSFVNVSANASSLWETETSASEYYQFKIDNITGEEGSFNWPGSKTNWFNVPLTGFVVAVNQLNYTDATDSAEIDINITVPSSEDPGIKSSSIVFLAELSE